MNIEEWSGYEVSNEALEQAASWIAMLDAPQTDSLPLSTGAKEDTHTLFFDWLQADPSHQQAYFELSEIWARSACTKSMSNMIDKSVVLPFPKAVDAPPQGLLIESNFGRENASPSWAYTVSIGLIICGLFLPAIQSLL